LVPPPENLNIDTTVAHMARIYDYLLGGTNHFAVDREVAERVSAAMPGGIDGVRTNIRANRDFLAWAVRWLAGEQGIRQFLDIGTGIPNADNVHAVAQETAPDARVVYVDHDPVVLAHAHELLQSTEEGATAYLDGDIREPERILTEASTTLDLGRPTALMLLGILHYVTDDEDPYGIVARLLDAVPSGSYLVVSHLASDLFPEEMAELAQRHNEGDNETAEEAVLRNRDEVERFFDGLELVAPGVVALHEWRPGGANPLGLGDTVIPIYVAIARKP
jgi:SAM-dependent methyltransferase